jgi:hypothetical protein
VENLATNCGKPIKSVEKSSVDAPFLSINSLSTRRGKEGVKIEKVFDSYPTDISLFLILFFFYALFDP